MILVSDCFVQVQSIFWTTILLLILQIMPFFDLLFGPKLAEFGASPTEKGAVVAVFLVFTQV